METKYIILTGGVMRKTCYSWLCLSVLLLAFVPAANAQVIFTIQYDDGNSQYYSGRPQPNDTCGVWFEPPTESQILSAQFNFNNNMGGDAQVYIWDIVDGFNPDNYFDNDEPGASPGPTPLGQVLAGPIPYTFNNTGTWQTITFADYGYDPEDLDVGTDNFFVGYVLSGGGAQPYYPSILGDAGDDRPYHSLCWLANPGGQYPGQSGWWAYGIDWLLRATVNMYGDPPPVISGIVDPPDTYLAGPYTIVATVTDQSTGGSPGQVTAVDLVYSVDGGTEVTVAMTHTTGDNYEANIPAVPVNSLINYRVEADDNAGHHAVAPSVAGYNFSYRAPSGAAILLVNDAGDHDGESLYRYALESNGYAYDFWYIASGDAEDMGYPGADVINTTNYKTVIWYTGTANSGSLPDNDANLATDPLAMFMDDGGNFFLSSSDYLGGAFNPDDWDEFTALPGTFMYEYLKVADGWSDAHINPGTGESMDTLYTGIAGDPISGVWASTYFADYPSPNYNDYCYPVSGAQTCFLTQIDDESAGIRYDGNYKMVFLPWILEACASTNVAVGILTNVLNYFDEGKIVMEEGSRYGIYGNDPHTAVVKITDPDGVNTKEVHYSWDGGSFNVANLTSIGNDKYTYDFTPPGTWATLEYYFTATDNLGNAMETPTYSCWFTGESYTAGATALYCSDQAYESIFGNFDNTITDALDALGVNYDIWDVDLNGAPDAWTVLSHYQHAIWVGYADWDETVFPMNSVDNPFSIFLKSGKSLLFSSEEMLGTWTGWNNVSFEPGNFAHDWLHIGSVVNDMGYTELQITGDPMVSGMTAPVELTGFPMDPYSDYFYPVTAPMVSGLFYDAAGAWADGPAGFRDNLDQHNVVALGFCLYFMDAQNLETFLGNVLDYFQNNPGVGVEPKQETGGIPITYSLDQNYPNPFNPVTNIRFALPENTRVQLSVYNLMGQEVARLLDRTMNAGTHTVTWDASQMSSGVYFYKVKAANFEMSRKMILVK